MRRRRRNPEDVPLTLCNPKRWHKKTVKRSWKHRDRFHDAIDDIAWEKASKRRHNPMRTRRNCDMTFLSQEQEDRIVSRITAKRNPGRRSKDSVKRWWKGLSAKKRMSVAKSVLGRMNPTRRYSKPKPSYTARVEATRHRDVKAWSKRMKRSARNPKRDGTPTRGELRAGKYVDHLRKIMAASENARLEYQRLTGAVAKAGSDIHKPVGPRAIKHAMKGHAEAWEAEHELTHHTGQFSAPSVAAVVAEHPELKFITSRLSDIDSTIAHFRDEISQLPKDDLSEDEEARLQEEIVKLAKQKQKLRQKLTEIQPAVSTNPRRRGGRRGRISHQALSLAKRASDRCAKAIRTLRSALRHLS